MSPERVHASVLNSINGWYEAWNTFRVESLKAGSRKSKSQLQPWNWREGRGREEWLDPFGCGNSGVECSRNRTKGIHFVSYPSHVPISFFFLSFFFFSVDVRRWMAKSSRSFSQKGKINIPVGVETAATPGPLLSRWKFIVLRHPLRWNCKSWNAG